MADYLLTPDGYVAIGSERTLFVGGYVLATGQTTITGTLSVIEAADTFAASGQVTHQGTLSAQELPDTFSMAGTVVPAAVPEAPAAPASGGSARRRRRGKFRDLPKTRQVIHTGTLSVREAPDTFSMRGYLTHRATLSAREAADTCRMAGDIDIYALAKRQDEEWLLLA